MPEISIIIPVYNEASNIPRLISKICSSLKGLDYEVIFVDDGSKDGTEKLVHSIQKKNERIKLIERGKKLGLSSAVIAGLKLSSGKYVCVMDGDLQHDPKYIPKMYGHILHSPHSIVIGSRFVKNLRNVQRPDSKLGTLICRHMLGIRAHDPLSGFFMLERKKFISLVPKIDPIGYKILLEVLAKGRFTKIIEAPIVFHTRGKGNSKLDLKTRVEFLKQLALLIAARN